MCDSVCKLHGQLAILYYLRLSPCCCCRCGIFTAYGSRSRPSTDKKHEWVADYLPMHTHHSIHPTQHECGSWLQDVRDVGLQALHLVLAYAIICNSLCYKGSIDRVEVCDF